MSRTCMLQLHADGGEETDVRVKRERTKEKVSSQLH